MHKFRPWVVGLGLLAVVILWVANAFNAFIAAEEEVDTAWEQVENQYQRRADLAIGLVAGVKPYVPKEQGVLDAVTDARAKAVEIMVDPAIDSPEQLEAYGSAQAQLGTALDQLIALADDCSELKADEHFQTLRGQLVGIENRIEDACLNFNQLTYKYNRMTRRFPNNIWAKVFGFELKPFYEEKN